MKKLLVVCLLMAAPFFKLSAQVDSLVEYKFDPSLLLSFPVTHTKQSGDFRLILEGRHNGIIYNLFVTDEYNYTQIKNYIELDSLYELILFNTKQIYVGDNVESNSYTYNFGELRGKYLLIESGKPENPYIAEYYLVGVKGRLYLMSVTYLKNYSAKQIEQAKNFVNTIRFDPQLTRDNQLNRL
ncbi:MAG: hypothetical protein IPP32_09415 [Bacteroidetes bacterium]|nr:hypothetical protein [Bacteroidota bacterium]